MRIAYIDHLIPDKVYRETEILEKELKARGLEIVSGSDLEEFLNQYGPLDQFDGVIIHPGCKRQKKIIEIHEANPNLPIVFVTWSKDDYTAESIPIFDYMSADKICAFLISKGTEGN